MAMVESSEASLRRNWRNKNQRRKIMSSTKKIAQSIKRILRRMSHLVVVREPLQWFELWNLATTNDGGRSRQPSQVGGSDQVTLSPSPGRLQERAVGGVAELSSRPRDNEGGAAIAEASSVEASCSLGPGSVCLRPSKKGGGRFYGFSRMPAT